MLMFLFVAGLYIGMFLITEEELEKEMWHFIMGDKHKAHIVPESLKDTIIKDLKRRGGKTYHIEETQRMGMDRGGMRIIGSPDVTFLIDGLEIGFACDMVSAFLSEFKDYKVREDFGQKYYKLHCYWNCLVLTPEQYKELLTKMEQEESSSKEKANSFYKEYKRRHKLNE